MESNEDIRVKLTLDPKEFFSWADKSEKCLHFLHHPQGLRKDNTLSLEVYPKMVTSLYSCITEFRKVKPRSVSNIYNTGGNLLVSTGKTLKGTITWAHKIILNNFEF